MALEVINERLLYPSYEIIRPTMKSQVVGAGT